MPAAKTSARQRLISQIVRAHRAQPDPCACQSGTGDECYVTEAFEACTDVQLETLLAGELTAA